MRKLLIGFLFALISVTSSQASTLRYEYQGLELSCETNIPNCGGEGDTFTGSLEIDETLIPAGGIAGATLDLRAIGFDGPYSFELRNSSGVFSDSFLLSDGPPALFFKTGGIVSDILALAIAGANYSFTFDATKQIIAWNGTCLCGGADYYSSNFGGDGITFESFSGPGSWTLESEPVPPVPLPASAWLLLAAVAGLVVQHRRVGSA